MRKTASEWVQEGAKEEDNPPRRVRHHFHNPLASSWDRAGLRVAGFPFGQSAVLWQQNPQQEATKDAGPGSWAWPNARTRYYEALTRPAKADREAAFATLFRSLGQVLHLVQDASLPAHTRNDAHLYETLFGFDLGNPDGYERWVDTRKEGELASLLSRPPLRPADAIFIRSATLPATSRTEHPGAPAPLKRLIDTGQYVGTNPEILTGDLIGLAEYSNGNFFSNDTVFADRPALFGQIPFPARTSVELGAAEEAPGTGGQLRRYFVKVRHGDTTIDEGGTLRPYRLAVPGALYDSLPDALKDKDTTLDPKVYEDYAAKLLPRAVGYSAALLDYFFRGRLDARVTAATLDASGFHHTVRIANRTPGEALDGTLQFCYDTTQDARVCVDGGRLVLAAGGETELPPIPPPAPDQPPAELGHYLLVFRGRLGDEPDAVVATRVRIAAWYVRTVRDARSCTRLPSNQFACQEGPAATGRIVVPGPDGTVEFDAGTVAVWFLSQTIGGPLFGSDNPRLLFGNAFEAAFQEVYLYRSGGGPAMSVTGHISASPFGGCGLEWGLLAGDVARLLTTTFHDPPRFAQGRGGAGTSTDGTFTFTVGPEPAPLLFRLTTFAGFVPILGAGTSIRSASCDLGEIRVVSE